jgi:hypothetical protein
VLADQLPFVFGPVSFRTTTKPGGRSDTWSTMRLGVMLEPAAADPPGTASTPTAHALRARLQTRANARRIATELVVSPRSEPVSSLARGPHPASRRR